MRLNVACLLSSSQSSRPKKGSPDKIHVTAKSPPRVRTTLACTWVDNGMKDDIPVPTSLLTDGETDELFFTLKVTLRLENCEDQ